AAVGGRPHRTADEMETEHGARVATGILKWYPLYPAIGAAHAGAFHRTDPQLAADRRQRGHQPLGRVGHRLRAGFVDHHHAAAGADPDPAVLAHRDHAHVPAGHAFGRTV